MAECWHTPPFVALRWHRWGEEYVVHHEASNDTHRLSAAAGDVLTRLWWCKRASVGDLALHAGLDNAEAASILEELCRLNLAATC